MFLWNLKSITLHYFISFFGVVKSVVYETPLRTADELIAEIMGVFQIVQTMPMLLETVRQPALHRCHVCSISDFFVGTLRFLAVVL
jgi:hypothetical protein